VSGRTSTLAGSTDADLYTRAVIAVGALLALNRDETMYYVATTDSAGQVLRSRCRYRISGAAPAARWWSVTAYAEDRFLFPNAERRYSINGGSAPLDARGHFSFETGPTAPAGAAPAAPWLPTPGDRGLSFTLRLYNPAAGLSAAPALAGRAHDRAPGELRMNLLRYLRIRNPWYCRLEVLAAVALLAHVLVVWAIPYVIMAGAVGLAPGRRTRHRAAASAHDRRHLAARGHAQPRPAVRLVSLRCAAAAAAHPGRPASARLLVDCLVRGQLRQFLRAQRPPGRWRAGGPGAGRPRYGQAGRVAGRCESGHPPPADAACC
jgi:hypothetical protein